MKDCKIFLKATSALAVMVLVFSGAVTAQIEQDIYYKYCEIRPFDRCFDPVEGAIDTVGRDVSVLGGKYRFCLPIDTIDAGFAPVRVILVLDNSASMCENPGSCSCDGDTTDNCMKNDPDDKRVEAAHVFVDSLLALNPQSEIGVIVFSGNASGHGPLSLETAENVEQVHSWINDAGCKTGDPGYGTNLGRGLENGLSLVDKNYDQNLPRHLILLTDGAWDDVETRSPQTILEDYAENNPGREQPTIHGVFISDSATHVAHGYPPQGCAGEGEVDLSYLKYSAEETGGLYFPGSRPETVIENFQTLLDSVAQPVPRTLQSVVVTNLANGETRGHTAIEEVPESIDGETHFQAAIDNLPVEFGLNTLTVQRVIAKPNAEAPETTTTTVSLFRTTEWTTTINEQEYSEWCETDSTSITISVSPPEQFINQAFDVASTIAIKEKFLLDTVNVRLFTENADVDDKQTIALFHFEEKLKNSIGTTIGTGDVATSADHALFGSSGLKSGSFSIPLGTVNGDFAFEAWIKPMSTNVDKDLFSTGNFSVGITADRHFTIDIDGKEQVKSALSVDVGAWSHVAVSRFQDNLYLFINGVAVSEPVSLSGSVTGVLTVSVPSDGSMDEVRMSTSHRFEVTATGELHFNIASLQNPTWTFAGSQVQQPVLIVQPGAWNNGNLGFQFSSPVRGNVIVNMQHRGTTLKTQWSKNSNPVSVFDDDQGPYVDSCIFTRGDFGTEFDTLDLFLSELVRCDSLNAGLPSASFQIYGPDGEFKSEIFTQAEFSGLSCGLTEWIRTLRILVKPNSTHLIVPVKDSIRMVGIAVDTAGNKPDSTRRGPIRYGPGSGLLLVAIPNDPEAGKLSRISDVDKDRIGIPKNDNSKLLMLQTREVLHPFRYNNGVPDYGEKTVIYDAVGNVVAADVPINQSISDDRMYYILWNGKNQNLRKVSTGAYLFTCIVRYEKDQNRKIAKQRKFILDWGRKNKL